MKTKIAVVTIVTFIVFFIEGLLHFNVGANDELKFEFYLPSLQQAMMIIVIVAFFSLLNGIVVSWILRLLGYNKK